MSKRPRGTGSIFSVPGSRNLWELALLRRAFSIGFDADPQKVSRVPKFHKFIVSEQGNERRGFVEEAQYRKLAQSATESWHYLFTRNGAPILDFRGMWDALVTAAGLPELLLHDFRRSAVRKMIRRGVPQKTAREISGHKTDVVFSRYNIVSEADIRDVGRSRKAQGL